jgi:hypothetical protein
MPEGREPISPNCGVRLPVGGYVGPLEGEARVCMMDIFILIEICTQDRIYILVDTLLG